MYEVFVENLEFYGYHGVSAEERKVGHRYQVSVSLMVDGLAPDSDDVADTVDYATIAQTVVVVSSSTQFRTVERLAKAIGQAVLAHFSLAHSVRVRVAKRLPPAEMMADSAGVEMVVSRAPQPVPG